MQTDPGTIQIAHRQMNVETGAEAVLFPEKEYISGIFVVVYYARPSLPILIKCKQGCVRIRVNSHLGHFQSN
jgi:hypothetical protein